MGIIIALSIILFAFIAFLAACLVKWMGFIFYADLLARLGAIFFLTALAILIVVAGYKIVRVTIVSLVKYFSVSNRLIRKLHYFDRQKLYKAQLLACQKAKLNYIYQQRRSKLSVRYNKQLIQ